MLVGVCCAVASYPKHCPKNRNGKRLSTVLEMEKNEDPKKFFARVGKITGVLASLGVQLPVEDVNLKIVEALTTDYEFEQRTILYRDNITRAEIEAIVRQRYIIMSRSTSKKNRIVGQALVTNKPARRNRKQESSGNNGRTGKGKDISGGAAATKNENSSTKDGERKYDDVRNKCHRCLEPSHGWFDCTAHVIPAAKKSHNGSGEAVGCLTIGMLGKSDAVGGREQSKDGTEKWVADSGATFTMTRSANLLRDVHPTEDKVKVGNDALIGGEVTDRSLQPYPTKKLKEVSQ